MTGELLLIFGALIVSASPQATRSHSSVDEKAGQGRVVAEILKSDPETNDAAALGRRIVVLGPEVAPQLLDFWSEAIENDGGPFRREVLRSAAAEFGRSSLLPLLPPLFRPEASSARRLAALDWFGVVGKSNDLESVLALAGTIEQGTPRTLEILRGSLKEILGRDSRAFSVLGGAMRRSSPAVVDGCVQAVGSDGSALALSWLAEQLDSDLGIDLLLLSTIEELSRQVLLRADAKVSERVRTLLWSDDPQVLRKAALAVGRLEDFEAAERLIELLDHEQACAREGAQRALALLTGFALPPDGKAWTAWYTSEIRWFHEEYDSLVHQVEDGGRAEAVHALLAIGTHRFDRHRMAMDVARALGRPEPEVRQLACKTLLALGSPLVLSELVSALDDPAPKVADEAWKALRAITGRDLPQQAEAWMEVL